MRQIFTFFLLFYSIWAFGQLDYQAIPHAPAVKNARFLAPNTQNDTLSLPFFEDFSTYTGIPDTNLWELGGGAIVNSGLAINPVSEGVATFDGVAENGSPYEFRENFPKGTADRLTSLPINLEGLTPSEDVYLSFFWQQAGFGEAPDQKQGDSLILEFKVPDTDSTFYWKVVWAIEAVDTIPFDAVFFEDIRLDDTLYFQPGFQFRFRNRGTLSGAYDNWHVDYIFMNASRFENDRFYLDRTIVRGEGRIFRDFASIPRNHLHPDSSFFSYLNPQNITNVRTLDANFSTYRIAAIFRDDSSGAVIQNYTAPFANIIDGYLSLQPEPFPLDQQAISNFNLQPKQKYYLSQSFILTSNGDGNTRGYDSRINDTAIYRGNLAEYYAYDDGSPELGVGIRTPFGKVAQEFALYEKDTMTAIDILFLPAERSITSTQIGIRIWDDLAFDIDPVIYGQTIVGQYGSERNDFIRVQLDSAVIVEDTIYIGWVQFDKTFLNVGYDMNNRFNEKIYTKVDPSVGWRNEADFEFPGAMMIRPVFDTVSAPIARGLGNAPQPGEEVREVSYDVQLSPNPASGFVEIDGFCEAFFIHDLNGQVVSKGQNLKPGDRISLDQLPNGSYILKFVNDGMLKNKRLQIFK